MENSTIIKGFSRLGKEEKIEMLLKTLVKPDLDSNMIKQFWFGDGLVQQKLDEISENAISNYVLPYSIAPNFKINNQTYFVPMVTEESSVVAAASASAKFWFNKGGFAARVISTIKVGQIHFTWSGDFKKIQSCFPDIRKILTDSAQPFLANMKKRGGGIKNIQLLDYSDKIPGYYQVMVSFDTADAMGANLINSCLEAMARTLSGYIANLEGDCEIIMSILSNHTPECLVECGVECDIEQFSEISNGLKPAEFARKFNVAVAIANIDIFRATTHNKGIFNGMDAVIIATGNDFRAAEAGGHAFAASDGHYKSLTKVEIENNTFKYILKVPLALGTVGGLTVVHPLAKISLAILDNPSARELMQITAAVGLANNFAAIRALITSGIQKGHMRFQLHNILNYLDVNEPKKSLALKHFKEKAVSYKAVEEFINTLQT